MKTSVAGERDPGTQKLESSGTAEDGVNALIEQFGRSAVMKALKSKKK